MAPNLDSAREFRNAVPDVLRRADEGGLTKLLDAASVRLAYLGGRSIRFHRIRGGSEATLR